MIPFRQCHAGRFVLLHCYGGLGRSAVVAAAALLSAAAAAPSPTLTAAEVVARIRRARGRRALAKKAQLEYVLDFRRSVLGIVM